LLIWVRDIKTNAMTLLLLNEFKFQIWSWREPYKYLFLQLNILQFCCNCMLLIFVYCKSLYIRVILLNNNTEKIFSLSNSLDTLYSKEEHWIQHVPRYSVPRKTWRIKLGKIYSVTRIMHALTICCWKNVSSHCWS
jgi:hypothetical protein